MGRRIIGAQGEVTIFAIDEIPAGIETRLADRTGSGWIISHSERGHHHICTGGEVMERVGTNGGMRVLYAILREPAAFVQDAPTPHDQHDLPAGLYEFRVAREYDPFATQARAVRD